MVCFLGVLQVVLADGVRSVGPPPSRWPCATGPFHRRAPLFSDIAQTFSRPPSPSDDKIKKIKIKKWHLAALPPSPTVDPPAAAMASFFLMRTEVVACTWCVSFFFFAGYEPAAWVDFLSASAPLCLRRAAQFFFFFLPRKRKKKRKRKRGKGGRSRRATIRLKKSVRAA